MTGIIIYFRFKNISYKCNFTYLFQISRSFAIVTACSSFLLIIQTFTPKATALRKLPDVDEFMIENHRTRTRTRQNYIVQREPDDEMSSGVENVGPAFVSEQLEPDSNHEELPALIVDYANMIRNDIILLDNSVETRTRKRGNVSYFTLETKSFSDIKSRIFLFFLNKSMIRSLQSPRSLLTETIVQLSCII